MFGTALDVGASLEKHWIPPPTCDVAAAEAAGDGPVTIEAARSASCSKESLVGPTLSLDWTV